MGVLEQQTIGHVRVLRLNRPERKNALTGELGWAIVRAGATSRRRRRRARHRADRQRRRLLLGPRPRAGRRRHADTGLTEQQQFLDEKGWIGRLLVSLRFETDKPVVAGVNGVAVGAGLSLALAADIRIAADSARLHPGYLRAGTSPDGGLTWSLPTLVGHEAAMRFLLESRFVDAARGARARARRRGRPRRPISTTACSTTARRSRSRRRSWCARPSDWSRVPSLVDDPDARVREEIRFALRGLNSEDGKEAVAAIMAKRAPEVRRPLAGVGDADIRRCCRSVATGVEFEVFPRRSRARRHRRVLRGVRVRDGRLRELRRRQSKSEPPVFAACVVLATTRST